MMNSLVSVGIGCSGEKILGRGAATFLRQRRTRIDKLSRQGPFGPVPTRSSSSGLGDFATSFGLSTACCRYYSMIAAISCGRWFRRLVAAIDCCS